jgi:hypothetical protein
MRLEGGEKPSFHIEIWGIFAGGDFRSGIFAGGELNRDL